MQTYATYADPSPQKRNFPPDLGAGASRQLRFNYRLTSPLCGHAFEENAKKNRTE